MTIDGKPYGPARYQQIVEECYQITKRLHTSYTDLYRITPLERKYLISFLKRDIERENELRAQAANKK